MEVVREHSAGTRPLRLFSRYGFHQWRAPPTSAVPVSALNVNQLVFASSPTLNSATRIVTRRGAPRFKLTSFAPDFHFQSLPQPRVRLAIVKSMLFMV